MILIKEKILNDLYLNGYSVLISDYFSFLEICNNLGNTNNTTHVKLTNDPSVRNLLAKPEAIPFHTDHPDIDIIAWFCIDPGIGQNSHMHLIDGDKIINNLTIEELNDLMSVMVKFPPTNKKSGGEYALVTRSLDDFRVYYAPWLITHNYSFAERKSLEQFQRLVAINESIEINLSVNTCLFVDNHRILHGRNQIEASSSRHLIRHWIKGFDTKTPYQG